MGADSKIEWTDHTLNFWIGCQEASPACDHCYARVQNAHWKWVDGWGPHGERRRTSGANWHQLRKWNKRAAETGVRAKVFSNSLADFFDNNRAVSTWRREAWHYIEQSPHLDFLILTKRPQNIAAMLPDPETGVRPWGNGWPNVWLGTTAENQEEADRRSPHLLAVPARHWFLSCEPLLGPLELDLCGRHSRIDWVICGGESGPEARPMHPTWLRGVRDQCVAAGVPFFFKQWGEWREFDEASEVEEVFVGTSHADSIVPLAVNPGWIALDGRLFHSQHDLPKNVPCRLIERIGKRAAGALLDGRLYREFPKVAA